MFMFSIMDEYTEDSMCIVWILGGGWCKALHNFIASPLGGGIVNIVALPG